MSGIITLSNIPIIRKRHESFQYSFHRGSPFSIISWQQPRIAGLQNAFLRKLILIKKAIL